MAQVGNGGQSAGETPASTPLSKQAWGAAASGLWVGFGWLNLAVVAWVAKGQISSIVAEATPTGQYSISGLLGFGQLTNLTAAPHATLNAWDQASVRPPFRHLPHWLWWYAGADALFIIGFAMLGLLLLRHRKNTRVGSWLLWLVVGGYTVELIVGAITLATAHASARGTGVLDAWAWILHFATVFKWLAVAALLGWLAYRLYASYRAYHKNARDGIAPDDRQGIYADLHRLVLALEVQRFSLVVVVLLGLLAIGPAINDVLEQLPDVQRAWLDSGLGYGHAIAAAIAQVLLAVMLLALGGMRARRADWKFGGAAMGGEDGDGRDHHGYWLWFIIPLALIALAFALSRAHLGTVTLARALAFSVPLLLIALASLVMDVFKRRPEGLGRPISDDRQDNVIQLVRNAGDVLAVAVIAVTPIGAVRSFTAPALVIGGRSWAPALLGVALALAVPLAVGLSLDAYRRGQGAAADGAKKPDSDLTGPIRAGSIAAALFIGADIWLIGWPFAATHVLGVLGTAVIAIGSLATLFGVLAYLGQTKLPLPLFRVLKLNATPVMTIIVIIGILGGIVDKNSTLHRVVPPAGPGSLQPAGSDPRPSFGKALGTWHSDLPASCAVPAGPPVDGHQVMVEPLIQVAASGGGIRAAWWTVKALSAIARSRCGVPDVFAVSSISGGSVGLAVLAAVGKNISHPVAAANAGVASLAGPDALAGGVDGLALRDTIAGYTGIGLPAAGLPTATFPDRAALMTQAWQAEDPALKQPFLERVLGRSWLPWTLLFNSTSVITGCHAIISTATLQPIAPGPYLARGDDQPCDLGTAGLTGGYDFLARLPCMRTIGMATAAMLSARFAYITPSGTVNGCQSGKLQDQLVDGGYGDATGISTLVHLAPAVMADVRLVNDQAIASARPGQPIMLVVPVTVYLGNSIQAALSPGQAARVTELQAVRTALKNGPATELTGTDALLQDMLAATGPAQWADCNATLCASAVGAAASVVPNQLMIVAPGENPGVAVPLGWLLSRASQTALDNALILDIERPACGRNAGNRPYCLPGVGGLSDLLLLTGR